MTTPIRCMARLRRCESGTAAIEFAVIALILILVCLGTIEFGRAFFLRNEMSYAADFAARKILTDPTITDAKLDEAVRAAFTGLDPEAVTVTIGSETANGLAFRTVSMEYSMTLLVPGLTEDPVLLSLSRRIPSG